jgi:hypothetical protein
MHTLTEFHRANHQVIAACQMLIDEGFTDIESYESFVHIYMSPWFDQMRQVALRLAGRGATLTVPTVLDAVALLEGDGRNGASATQRGGPSPAMRRLQQERHHLRVRRPVGSERP